MIPWPAGEALRTAQDLEDLATASWLSETLFAALDLRVFETLGESDVSVDELALRCGADPTPFLRFLRALSSLGLLSLHADRVAATALARQHLVPGAEGYLGHSLRYRSSLARTWSSLAAAVRSGHSPVAPQPEENDTTYATRVHAYMLAMDDVARHKAQRIAERLNLGTLRSKTVLDLAGGAGAIGAELLRRNPGWNAVILDMPEVCRAAETLWRDRGWDGLHGRLRFHGTNLLSDALPPPPGTDPGWGVIIASNIIHAYGEEESAAILDAAAAALAPDGILVVHDFWADGCGRGPAKAALFDLHMLLHTYQGRTYPWQWVCDQLAARGLETLAPVVLGDGTADEDTSLVVAARNRLSLEALRQTRVERLASRARQLGFADAVPLTPRDVVTAKWVREKCRFGCSRHGAGGRCPPLGPAVDDMQATLSAYETAILVRGEPPTAEFQRLLLELERQAFLADCPKALAFGAGPCSLCAVCTPQDCQQPDRARPSLEACGVDVYATAAAAGWRLRVVPDRSASANYVGLLLVD